MAGLRFLGLIDADGIPTKELVAITKTDEAGRKGLLKQILMARYAPLFAIKLEGATFGQLEGAMSTHYSVSSETKEKAIRFFLSACRYTGVPLSSFLMKANTAPSTRKRKPRNTGSEAKADSGKAVTPPAPPLPPSGAGAGAKTITLRGGAGVVTVTMTIDMLALDDDDDAWVRKLRELLRSYKEAPTIAPPDEGDEDEDSEENE